MNVGWLAAPEEDRLRYAGIMRNVFGRDGPGIE